MGQLYLLFESSSGYALFERVKGEEISLTEDEVQKNILNLEQFSRLIKLKAFQPFTSAENALENINSVSEGEVTESLATFLEMNLPKSSADKKAKFSLGVGDNKMGNTISEGLGIKCKCNDLVLELIRGIRLHFHRFIPDLKLKDWHQSQLGLGHSYSRCKVKFNVHRVDNMIIQSICLLDQLDKDLNTFAMRVREWYSWHFPELVRVVNDNYMFARIAKFIKNRNTLNEESAEKIEEITNDADIAKQVIAAAKMSMGTDISPIDMINIERFADRVISLSEYRTKLYAYLCSKMNLCAPNLSALIGEQVGARLISHAGSLTSLAKYPASTVQILGAEKALFRALKTKGNTPKYGLIFRSTFIGQAGPKNKGRISRYLANKCSLASRIDSFTDEPTNEYGLELKKQVEERLDFYKTGVAPRKNIDVMKEVLSKTTAEGGDAAEAEAAPAENGEKKKKKKKRKAEEAELVTEDKQEKKKKKKDKKAKKSKK